MQGARGWPCSLKSKSALNHRKLLYNVVYYTTAYVFMQPARPQELQLLLKRYPHMASKLGRLLEVSPCLVYQAGHGDPFKLTLQQWNGFSEAQALPEGVHLYDEETIDLAAANITKAQESGGLPKAVAVNRRINLSKLTRAKGSIPRIAQLLGVSVSTVNAALGAPVDKLGRGIASRYAQRLSLPLDWFDANQPLIPTYLEKALNPALSSEAEAWQLIAQAPPTPVTSHTDSQQKAVPSKTESLPGIHGAFLEKYSQLVAAGKVSEALTHTLFGLLLKDEFA